MNAPPAISQPFESLASEYDEAFTHTLLGGLLRDAVHEELADVFEAGEDVIDLGCGTGEDALRLARRGVRVTGLDSASRMIDVARSRAGRLRDPDAPVPMFYVADLNEAWLPPGPFAGALSNFGAMNCVRDRGALAKRLAAVLSPGAAAAFVVMGPSCPWEWVWYGARGRLKTAVRRLERRVAYRGLRVSYPSAAGLAREFMPYFRHRRTAGIGVLLPPSFAAHVIERHPNAAARIAAVEGRIRRYFPATVLNDHYLIVLERL